MFKLGWKASKARLAVGITVASLTLTACGGGGSESTSDPSGEADPAATLRFSFGTDGGKNYDPLTAANQFVPTFLLPVYDRLFDIDAEGKVVPMLVESHTVSDDGLSLELKLREGVKFHDGAELNADAVKANFDRALTSEKSTLKSDLASVASVDVVDPMTVKFTLKSANGALPAILADRAGMMVSPNALQNPDLDLMPVGAGPYKVTANEPGVKVTYEKFEDYWNPNEDSVQKIELMIQIDPEARLRAVGNGEVDAAGLNMNQVSTINQQNIRIADKPEVSSGVYLVYLNMAKNPALADEKVREALALALDRDGIGKGVLGDQCAPTAQIFPDGYWPASEDLPEDAAKQDVEQAKKLLEESGHAGFTMTLSAISAQQYANVAEAVAAQFEEIGVKVELQIAEPVQVVGNFNAQKVTDAYVSLWPGATDPSKTVGTLLLPTGLFNPGALDIPDVTSLAAEGIAKTEQSERQSVYQELANKAAEHRMHLPICSPNNPNAVSDKVRNLLTTVAGAVDLRNVEIVE